MRGKQEAVAVEWLQFVEQALLFLQPTFQVGRALPHVTRCLLSPYVEVRVAALQCLRQCVPPPLPPPGGRSWC